MKFQEGMDSMIKKLYVNLMKERHQDSRDDLELRKEILKILENEGKNEEGLNYEEIQDIAFLVAEMAKEDGFVQGFKYAFCLFAECIRE